MKLSPIVLKLRLAETRFENRIAGSADLANALTYTLKQDTAFVVQLNETASANTLDNGVSQSISERFAVIVALNNGTSDRDKTGLTAYDTLFDVRTEIFSALLGWQMSDENGLIPGIESVISYGGGRIASINRGYLWYQFEFLVTTDINECNDGVDVGADDLPPFDTIYAQWIISPSAKFDAIGKSLPINIVDPDMTTIIDFTSNPAVDGGFANGFGIKFDTFKG